MHSPSLWAHGAGLGLLFPLNIFSSAGKACNVMHAGIGPAPTEKAGSKTACWPPRDWGLVGRHPLISADAI